MRIVFGIWGPWDRQSGGISKSFNSFPTYSCEELILIRHSFLVKDAQDDLQGMRLKV